MGDRAVSNLRHVFDQRAAERDVCDLYTTANTKKRPPAFYCRTDQLDFEIVALKVNAADRRMAVASITARVHVPAADHEQATDRGENLVAAGITRRQEHRHSTSAAHRIQVVARCEERGPGVGLDMRPTVVCGDADQWSRHVKSPSTPIDHLPRLR